MTTRKPNNAFRIIGAVLGTVVATLAVVGTFLLFETKADAHEERRDLKTMIRENASQIAEHNKQIGILLDRQERGDPR